MTSQITFDHIRQARRGWTTRLAEVFLEQLSSHHMFMDIDVIPGVWVSRSISMRQHWAGDPNAAFR
jgi:hypothetical protein